MAIFLIDFQVNSIEFPKDSATQVDVNDQKNWIILDQSLGKNGGILRIRIDIPEPPGWRLNATGQQREESLLTSFQAERATLTQQMEAPPSQR